MLRTQTPAEKTPTPPLGGNDIIHQMADKMREMGANGVAVTADSLAEHSDFTRAEIQKYGPDAADLAKTERNRQLS